MPAFYLAIKQDLACGPRPDIFAVTPGAMKLPGLSRIHLSSGHTYQVDNPIGLDLKLAT